MDEMVPHWSRLGNSLGIRVPTTQTCIQGEVRSRLEAVTKAKGKKKKNPTVVRVHVSEC